MVDSPVGTGLRRSWSKRLRLLDKIGAKLRGPQPAPASPFERGGVSGWMSALGADSKKSLDDLTGSQKEIVTKNLAPLKQIYDSLGDSLAELKNKSEVARVESKLSRMELEKLPPRWLVIRELKTRQLLR
jgi:hypothetical protein